MVTKMTTKFVLVTGGVISGVGKGIISSSLGVILKSHGYRVSAIKIDPYINIDAGTFSPHEHGEVFVLDDGGEVDLDLGNYERFLNARLTRDNNITTGKIYKQVIDKERRGDYLGQTVQVIPHVTNEIINWVERVACIPIDGSQDPPQVCIIELGGTVGDIEGMQFAEAFREFQFRIGADNFMNVHVSLLLQSTGEQKTKPIQNSVKSLRQAGLFPHIIICRSTTPLQENVREKISNFCMVRPEKVLSVHDVANIYHVPLLLYEQNTMDILIEELKLDKLPPPTTSSLRNGHFDVMKDWRDLAESCDHFRHSVNICLVGKYMKLEDAYTSVIKALKHAAVRAKRNLNVDFINSEDLEQKQEQSNCKLYHKAWEKLASAQGILVPGGFGERGIEGKIAACGWARTRNIPFLGICLGMQSAVIEFSRNVCGIRGANSTEFDQNLTEDSQVVVDMPEHAPGRDKRGMGASMRLGRRTTVFLTNASKLRYLYGNVNAVDERHRHRYEVNPKLAPRLAESGLRFVGMGVDEGSPHDVIGGREVTRTDSSNALMALAADHNKNNNNCFNNVKLLGNTAEMRLREKVRMLCQKGGTGLDKTALRLEIIELKEHPYFVGVQFHPEYLSNPMKPSAPYLGLVLAASKQLDKWLLNDLNADAYSSTETKSPSMAKNNGLFLSNGNGLIKMGPTQPIPIIQMANGCHNSYDCLLSKTA